MTTVRLWIKQHYFCAAAIIVLVLLIGILGYLLIDQAVSLDHASVELGHVTAEVDLLRRLVVDVSIGMGRQEIIELLKRKYAAESVLIEKETISVGNQKLHFSGSKLVRISSLGDE